MSMEDYELMHRMIENERSERMAEIKQDIPHTTMTA